MYVPPWLDVNPGSFVQAAAAGGRLGEEIANRRTQAILAANRERAGLAEAQLRANTELAGQSASEREAASRLSATQKQSDSERALRQWEVGQQIKQRQDAVEAQNERAAGLLNERSLYGQNMLDIRREANRIAQEKVDNAKNKTSPSDFMTVTEYTKEVPPTKSYSVNEPEVHNWFSSNTPAKSFSTTNATDLVHLPTGTSIVTNTIPGTGIPSRSISRRIPVDQNPYALKAAPESTPPSPLEGKRVRDKVTGKTGTITNGAFVPDSEDNATNP